MLELLTRLKGSYTVQEQEAGKALEDALDALFLIKKLVLQDDLFANEQEILVIIERVINGSN